MKSKSRLKTGLDRLKLRLGVRAAKALVFVRGDVRERYDFYRSKGLSKEQAVEKLAWYYGVPKEKLLKRYGKSE